MKLVATDRAGRTLMTSLGGAPVEAFAKTVAEAFPRLRPEDIVITQGDAPVPRRALPAKCVVWKGPFYDLGGYAGMNREITQRLLLHGFSVRAEPMPTSRQVDPLTEGIVDAMARAPVSDGCPVVLGCVPTAANRSGMTIFYTMQETQTVHPEFLRRCREGADELWVPCPFYKDVFATGFPGPIHVMPLGVNHLLYKPDAPPRPSHEGFVFASVFGWNHRKGPDVLCRAFLRAFSKGEATLVIYSRHYGKTTEEGNRIIAGDIAKFYAECKNPRAPEIIHCGDEIPISEMPGCYTGADCFVFCSRGEGFGLPVIEAGACGTPVLSTYNTAMESYLDDDSAYLVRTDELEDADGRTTCASEYYRGQKFPKLGEKSVEEFAALMREVRDDPAGAEGKALRLRARILDAYTWDACAGRVAQRLI